MKTLYLDCGMGAAGDMLSAALIELLPEPAPFIAKLNSLKIPGVELSVEKSVKCGITGTLFSVKVHGREESEEMHMHHHDHHDHHEHHHSGMEDILRIINGFDISDKVRKDIIAVYELLAEAESHAHGVPVAQIHFHEVGTMDAVADITAVCMLMDELSPDKVIASPVCVGGGQVRCAHGILPVPAPATAYILKDVPIYAGKIKSELCTPTGAALLKYFADSFGDMPMMKVKTVGYGMGKKDFETANCVRAMLGESADSAENAVIELSCNIDDMTAEDIGFAVDRLFCGGALDVYTVPIGMKKSRPGTLISVICREEDREKMLSLIFRHTTTIGIREAVKRRYVLERRSDTVQTPCGEVRRKTSAGFGVSRVKYEYDDLSRIAAEKNMSLEEVRKLLEKM